MDALVQALTQRDSALMFLASVSFIAILIVVLTFLIRGKTNTIHLKILGTFLVILISLLANNVVVYGLSIFIIATLVTDLKFLLDLAAIFWNRNWWKTSPATEEDLTEKVTSELKQDEADENPPLPGTTAPPAQPVAEASPEHMAPKAEMKAVGSLHQPKRKRSVDPSKEIVKKALQFENDVLTALSEHNIIPGKLERGVRLDFLGNSKYIIDALIQNEMHHYVIEVKSTPSASSVMRGLSKLGYYMGAYNLIYPREKTGIETKGIIIVPAEAPVDDIVGKYVAILKFDTKAKTFTNLAKIQPWL